MIKSLDYEKSLFFSVVRRAKRETHKWPRAWLMARDGRWLWGQRVFHWLWLSGQFLFFYQAAALVSRVSRLRRSRARALPLLNRKKKRDCSKSIKSLTLVNSSNDTLESCCRLLLLRIPAISSSTWSSVSTGPVTILNKLNNARYVNRPLPSVSRTWNATAVNKP